MPGTTSVYREGRWRRVHDFEGRVAEALSSEPPNRAVISELKREAWTYADPSRPKSLKYDRYKEIFDDLAASTGSVCPETGEECFLGDWLAAAEQGKGSFGPREITAMVSKALLQPEVSAHMSCAEVTVDDDGPREPSCTAFSLLVSLSVMNAGHGPENRPFDQNDVIVSMVAISGIDPRAGQQG